MKPVWHLFERMGLELEYMIVDEASLDVRPEADALLRMDGEPCNAVCRDAMGWSNELARHVIELKTEQPVVGLSALAKEFQRQILDMEAHLSPLGCRLLPGPAHPWMDPMRETRLWPFGDQVIYRAFDRIFDCRGHGWSNLQAVHLNLSFHGDEEFRRLHSAIRVLLPLMPALFAGSPILDGTITGMFDTRMFAYRDNCQRIPAITGATIPEVVAGREDYEQRILQPIYTALRETDPDGVLAHEWVNARGAIARFARNAIEIRLLDIQESPVMDTALCQWLVELLKDLVYERHASLRMQEALTEQDLAALLYDVARCGGRAPLRWPAYATLFGASPDCATVTGLIENLFAEQEPAAWWHAPVRQVLVNGCLAERILHATGAAPSRARLCAVYGELADCLRNARAFIPSTTAAAK